MITHLVVKGIRTTVTNSLNKKESLMGVVGDSTRTIVPMVKTANLSTNVHIVTLLQTATKRGKRRLVRINILTNLNLDNKFITNLYHLTCL